MRAQVPLAIDLDLESDAAAGDTEVRRLRCSSHVTPDANSERLFGVAQSAFSEAQPPPSSLATIASTGVRPGHLSRKRLRC